MSILPNLVSASVNKTLKFWDRENDEVQGEGGEFERIIEVGGYIVATSHCIEVFNITPPHKKFSLEGHKKRIRGICKIQLNNYNSPLIATGGDDSLIKIWNLKLKAKKFTSKEEHKEPVMCLLQHSSQCLISGGTSETIIWKIILLPNKKIQLEIKQRIPNGANNIISGIIQINERKMLSYIHNSDLIKIWDFDNSSKDIVDIRANISPEFNGFRSGIALTDRKQVILGGENGQIYLFDLTTETFKKNYKIHNKSINQLCLLNQSQIITCSSDCNINIVNIDNYERKRILGCQYSSVIDTLLLTDNFEENQIINMKEIIKSSNERTLSLQLISAIDNEIIFLGNDLTPIKSRKIQGIYSLIVGLNNEQMAAAKDNGEIDIIDLLSARIEFTLEGHTGQVVGICVINTENINEHIIATGAEDNTIRIWNLLNKECIRILEGVGILSSLIYYPKAGSLVSATNTKVIIRNYKTLLRMKSIDHGEAPISQLFQISEENIISICNSVNLSMKIWNIENGETVRDIIIPDSPGLKCGVLLDNHTLLLGEVDTGKVYSYDLKSYNVTNTYQIHQNIIQIWGVNKSEIIFLSEDKTLKIFDIINRGEANTILNEHKNKMKSVFPVVLPSSIEFLHISLILKEYIIQIGCHKYNIMARLLHRITPYFRFYILQGGDDLIQIEYIDADISYNDVFISFIDNKLTINEDNLAEAIILGKYFPMIKIKYEHFIKQHSFTELFDINKANDQLWNNIFTNQAQDKSNYYSIYIYIYLH